MSTTAARTTIMVGAAQNIGMMTGLDYVDHGHAARPHGAKARRGVHGGGPRARGQHRTLSAAMETLHRWN
jgi:hypothetical protein